MPVADGGWKRRLAVPEAQVEHLPKPTWSSSPAPPSTPPSPEILFVRSSFRNPRPRWLTEADLDVSPAFSPQL